MTSPSGGRFEITRVIVSLGCYPLEEAFQTLMTQQISLSHMRHQNLTWLNA